MKVKVQIIIESGASDIPVVEEIACLQRENLTPFRRILVFVVFKAFTTIGAY